MPSDDDLLDLLAVALAPAERVPPPERLAAVRDTVRETRIPSVARLRLDRWRRVAALAAAAAVVVAFAAGVTFAARDDGDRLAAGVVEFEETLRAPTGGAAADVTGVRTGIGRIVRIRTDDLAILPTGEFYEVWFVGPGDTPETPNRISAGTFHPDEQGQSRVDLTAAVDPKKYPRVSVTAEPGDGDPASTRLEVLGADVTVTG